MELWDGYNADMTLAGVDIVREDELIGKYPKGLYHLVADVIVRHTDGTFLVMQRDFNKVGFPGEWEIGAGGSVLKGESAYEGAVRELCEETGVFADKLISLGTVSVMYDSGVGVHYFIYLCTTDMDKSAVKMQQGETIDYKWLTDKEIVSGHYIPERRVALTKKLCNNEYIVTERLLLRPLALTDIEKVHLYASDREITRYMMNLPNDTIEESQRFLEDAVAEWQKSAPDFYEFAVVHDGTQIGGVCLYLTDDKKQGELGWILASAYHGKGFAAEAAKAMLVLARQFGLEAVFARCDSRNKPSEKLMQRLGMKLSDNSGTRFYEKRGETVAELKYELKLK